MAARQRLRNWMVTINDCKEHPLDSLLEGAGSYEAYLGAVFERSEGKITYLVGQHERGDEKQREHLQLYAEFKTAMEINPIKRLFGCTWLNLQVRRGSQEQAITYVTKEDTRMAGPWSFGERNQQGRRTDIEAVAQMAADGADVRSIAMAHPASFIRMHRGIHALVEMYETVVNRTPIRIFFWSGETGIGKTRWINNYYPPSERVFGYNDSKEAWMDGYTGQEVIVMDEFQGLTPLHLMLKLLDGQGMRWPKKGGMVNIKATVIILMSNMNFFGMYGGQNTAWRRRLTEGENGDNVVVDLASIYGDRVGAFTPEEHGIVSIEALPRLSRAVGGLEAELERLRMYDENM